MSKQYRFWVHSCRVRTPGDEAVIVNEKVATIQDDGTISYSNHLNTIVNPKKSYFIHQQKYHELYNYKIEYVPRDQCDEYICYNKDLEQEIKNHCNELGMSYTPRHLSMRELCQSPYLYGADIDIEVLTKIAYLRKTRDSGILPPLTFGALDLEVSVLGDGKINLASFCYDGVVYCAILDEFLFKTTDEIDSAGHPKRAKATLDDIKETVQKEISDYLERFHLKVVYYVASNEMDLIAWTFKNIHECKPDFIGAWNMPYDVPKLIERITENHGDPADYFCHPDVPAMFKKCNYRADTSQVEHFTDSWDWFNCPGYTQWIDSMRLYSRLRKVKGREPSYRLGFISMKEIQHGKLDLPGTHHDNQLYNFLYYTAYNIVDAANVWLMEQQNGDVSSMCMLVGNSLLRDFSKQTVMLKNDFYEYCEDRGMVAGTVGTTMGTPYDDMLGKAGGTVLPPYLARDMGLQCVQQRPDLHTLVNIFIKDIDASSMYPNTMIGFNISKETTKATIVKLHGYKTADIEELCTGMIAPRENALLIGPKYFSLPTPSEMLDLYSKWFKDRQGKSPEQIREELYMSPE